MKVLPEQLKRIEDKIVDARRLAAGNQDKTMFDKLDTILLDFQGLTLLLALNSRKPDETNQAEHRI